MEHPEWLGFITINETKSKGGKLWIYYDNSNLVCSMFYMLIKQQSLIKYNIFYDANIVGALGPIMVKNEYLGNKLMYQMLKEFEKYNKVIGNKYIFTKVATDNIRSIKNFEENGYQIVHTYNSERGINNAYLKKI